VLTAALKGFGIGAGLIVAIGSQNAFVLSSALRNQHVLLITLLCMSLDAVLIIAGIWGMGALIQSNPLLISLATWGGALFLFVYGLLAFRRALMPETLEARALKPMSVRTAVLTTLALSLLNPHVYLDTVVLLGSIGGQLPDNQPFWFGVGACLASVVWFGTLGAGGRMLGPWFASPKNWQRLDIMVGLTMWVIALSLVLN
jgi:L-lysine exporter family protein LysE/ArgO